MYLPGWLYELKPLAYAAAASGGFAQSSLQPLGTYSASLAWLGAAFMIYMRIRFRKEHRGYYWHRRERRGQDPERMRATSTASETD